MRLFVEVEHDTFFASNGNLEKSKPQMAQNFCEFQFDAKKYHVLNTESFIYFSNWKKPDLNQQLTCNHVNLTLAL